MKKPKTVADDVDQAQNAAPVVDDVDQAQNAAPVVDDVGQAQNTAPVVDDVDQAQNAAPIVDDPVQDDAPLERLFTIQVVKSPAGKRTRAGMSFTSAVSEPIDFSTLTQDQIEALASDPYLRIKPFKG